MGCYFATSLLYGLKIYDDKDLENWENSEIRSEAYYVVGKIHISFATKTGDQEKFGEYIKNAIKNFEKSLNECYYSPAKFCSVFYGVYKDFLSIQSQDDLMVIKNNIENARKISKNLYAGGFSKEKLVDVMENLFLTMTNLAGALNLSSNDIHLLIHNFPEYAKYCNMAEDLIKTHHNKAPIAFELLDIARKEVTPKQTVELAKLEQFEVDSLIKYFSKKNDQEIVKILKKFSKYVTKKYLDIEDAKSFLSVLVDPSISYLQKEKLYKKINSITNQSEFDYVKKGLLEQSTGTIAKLIEEVNRIATNVENLKATSSKKGVTSEIVIEAGVNLFGTGVKQIVRIPTKEFTRDEIKELRGKAKKVKELPEHLKNKIIEKIFMFQS